MGMTELSLLLRAWCNRLAVIPTACGGVIRLLLLCEQNARNPVRIQGRPCECASGLSRRDTSLKTLWSSEMQPLPLPSGDRINLARNEQPADPAAYRPGQQPRQPVPVRPTFAPVWNGGANAHHFTEDEEPKHMPCGTAWGEAGAEPRTQDRDNDEGRSARDQRVRRRNMTSNKIAREDTREQGVRCQHKKNGHT